VKVLPYAKTTQQGQKKAQNLGCKFQNVATNSPKHGKLSPCKLTNMEIGFDEKPQDVNNLLGKDLPNL